MKTAIAAAVLLVFQTVQAAQPPSQPVARGRILELVYDPAKPIVIPVQRGVGTRVELPGEFIQFGYPGEAADCKNAADRWCVTFFTKTPFFTAQPKQGASAPGQFITAEVTTDARSYSFEFRVVGPGEQPAQRAIVRMAPPTPADPAAAQAAARMQAALALMPTPADVVEARLSACPEVRNTNYTLALGKDKASERIVPRAVFNDGHFTYFKFGPGQPVPVVFDDDGTETTTNQHVECGFVAVDRVRPRLVLRHGDKAVVYVDNANAETDAREMDGGTVSPGLQRLVRDPRTNQFKESQP